MQRKYTRSLETFLACRLVPLDKRPGLRPIGVDEVLRRIAGKMVMYIVKKDVLKSSSKIQMCSGQNSGSEAAIHAVRELFDNEAAEAVLLVDAANAFNNINRNALLNNIRIICPNISQYVINCYHCPARLFIIGGKELASKEGTTQGDPLAMAIYAIGLTPLLEMLMHLLADFDDNTKMVAFADDLTGVGHLQSLKNWWEMLCEVGQKFGYYPQSAKSWLIVKEKFNETAVRTFDGSNVKITTSGQRHLGAVIGDITFQKQYCEEIIKKWVAEIKLLSEIALIEPQAAYTSYVSGFQNKFTYRIYCNKRPPYNKRPSPISAPFDTKIII